MDAQTDQSDLPADLPAALPAVLPAIAQGHPEAASALLDRYGGLLWTLARRMSPTAADAEDAVQDILVELVRSAHRFDASIAGESTFIATVARRRLIDRTRKRGRERTEPGEERIRTLEDSRSPERASNRALFGEDARRAFEAMEALSDQQRRCISLWACHGLSHEQISRATGLPLGTTKAHIRRGLMRLRRELTGDPSPATVRNGEAPS
ncbi:MAG: sigma-70 family RNA polymerase sigma factor [Phycisphaerales bacterium]